MKSRYAKIRQLNKNNFVSVYLVENKHQPGKYFELKTFKSFKLYQKERQRPQLQKRENASKSSNSCKSSSSSFSQCESSENARIISSHNHHHHYRHNGRYSNSKDGELVLMQTEAADDANYLVTTTDRFNNHFDLDLDDNGSSQRHHHDCYDEVTREQHNNNDQCNSNSSNSDSKNTEFLELISKLTELRHPFISQYYEMSVQSGTVYVVTERAFPGCFSSIIDERISTNKQPFEEELVLRWTTQLLLALVYLEETGSVYLSNLSMASTALINNGSSESVAKLVDLEVRREKAAAAVGDEELLQ